MSFVHLHLHTNYSILEWLWKPKEFVKRAKELGMTGLAITDTWNLYWAFEFYKACKENWINPIIWVEVSISKKWIKNKDKDNEYFDIILLAKNLDWYRNLIELVTFSFLEWFYYRPRIDFETLKKYSQNLIWLSWSYLGEIPQHISTWKSEDYIVERVNFYQDLFWKDDFYLEIQEHSDRPNQLKINEYLLNLSKKYQFKLVATNDVHYLTENDNEAQDLLFCIWDWRALDDPDRPTLIEWNYSLRKAEEMEEIFSYAPQACSNTSEINEKINIEIPYGKLLLPNCELQKQEKEILDRYRKEVVEDKGLQKLKEEEWYLRYMCIKWLNYRYNFGFDEKTIFEFIKKIEVPILEKKLSEMSFEELKNLSKSYYTDKKNEIITNLNPSQQEIIERLEYELVVVNLMWFNWYFIIVADFIKWAKENDVPVWPGRWSVAWWLMAFLSSITDIDPLKYSLLFERFLNPARVTMPDIDVDFSDEWRWKVLDYVKKKYWEDRVAQICTFGTMAARAAVKDIWRVLWVSFAEMNNLAKLIPARPWIKIKDALEESVEFRNIYNSNDKYKKLIDNAMKLEWSVRQLWVHACAVIIAPEKITNFCALQHPPKDETTTVTQLSQYPIEDLWLLKMDFLWLRNLTIIRRCLAIIKKNHDKDIDLLKISYEDKKVFKLFSDWDTTWVFQFESNWMRRYLKDLKPNTFEDIIAMVALYRPWPLQYIPTYIERKHWREKVKYPHISLENILRPTQWIAIYQEQIMQLVQEFAWFSLWEADILRRAIWKKKADLLMEQKQKFIDAAVNNLGHPWELAKYIFEEIIEPFAWYGFNKSHAACYAMIAYETAYLKAHYPTEFMTSLMVSDEEDMDRITLEIDECKAKSINILAPDINESMKHFTYIDKNNIRFWLKAIKWLWDWPIETIKNWRETKPYESLIDFIINTWGDVINKKSLEALTLSWALDVFWERASILASISKMTAFSKENQQKNKTNQIWLFDSWWENFDNLKFNLEETHLMSFEEKIKWEKQIIGYTITGHPLDWLKNYILKKSSWLSHVYEFKKKLETKTYELIENEFWFIEENESWTNEVATSEDISWVIEQKNNKEPMEEEQPNLEKIEKKNKWYNDNKKVRFFWVITNIRKIQTKAWKMMLVVNCDSFDFKFNITIFPKDYDKFSSQIEETKIIMVEWFLKLNEQIEEISVIANNIRTTTITFIRNQAKELNLFDENDKVNFVVDKLEDLSVIKEEEKEKPKIQKEESYILKIDSSSTKEDLLEIKEFLCKQKSWETKIYLDIWGKIIDTKISIDSLDDIKNYKKFS